MAFGLKPQIADGLWIRALQDFDYCERSIGPQRCVAAGWLFHMLDLITELAPDFRMPFATGGLVLTVLVNDFEGASRLFDKAVIAFPNDWPILMRAGYHALYEENDPVKAGHLLERAARNGGPEWQYLLAAKLYGRAGRLEFAQRLLAQMESDPAAAPALVEALRRRVASLQAAPTSGN